MEANGMARKNNHAANDRRYRTLTQLEKILKLLVDRHGARMTLGEMLAITAAMARWCKQDQVSLAEIAEATGLPKQNLSRWAKKRLGDSISLKVNDDDQRMHDVLLSNPAQGQENLERLADVMGLGTTDPTGKASKR
jgi:hypothetical protein